MSSPLEKRGGALKRWGLTFSHRLHGFSKKAICVICGLRNDLFAFGFALELLENRANRGGVTAARRELQILLIRGNRVLRLVNFLVRRAEHLVDHGLTI